MTKNKKKIHRFKRSTCFQIQVDLGRSVGTSFTGVGVCCGVSVDGGCDSSIVVVVELVGGAGLGIICVGCWAGWTNFSVCVSGRLKATRGTVGIFPLLFFVTDLCAVLECNHHPAQLHNAVFLLVWLFYHTSRGLDHGSFDFGCVHQWKMCDISRCPWVDFLQPLVCCLVLVSNQVLSFLPKTNSAGVLPLYRGVFR